MKVLDREVVLKALVGSHNYNLANEESDKDYKVFITPTFEELYNGTQFSKQIITPTEDNDIHDIRKLSNLFFKANVNFLEVLASNEIIIPDGNPEINKIYEMRKDIFKMNLPHLYNACKGMYYNKMKLVHKGTEGTQHLVDAYGYDTKQALHAYRSLKVIVDFEATNFEDFAGAIRYSGEDLQFMLEVRHGFYKFEVFENFIDHYMDSQFTQLAKKYNEQPVNLELKAEIDNLIMSLVKRNLK
jgi:hypothetical protein